MTGLMAAAHLRGMAARGVPLRSVRGFIRVAASAVFSELWHRAGPGDGTALLPTSRLLAARRDTAERLLREAYESTPEHVPAPDPAPRVMEVV
jgi:hypothetical protein